MPKKTQINPKKPKKPQKKPAGLGFFLKKTRVFANPDTFSVILTLNPELQSLANLNYVGWVGGGGYDAPNCDFFEFITQKGAILRQF